MTCPWATAPLPTGSGGRHGRQSPSAERLPLVSPAWRHLTWIGFISEARHQSIFYVDNLDARRERP